LEIRATIEEYMRSKKKPVRITNAITKNAIKLSGTPPQGRRSPKCMLFDESQDKRTVSGDSVIESRTQTNNDIDQTIHRPKEQTTSSKLRIDRSMSGDSEMLAQQEILKSSV
jgi:hypothetical protein